MAKYYGVYSCGHKGEVNIIGPMKDREWKREREFSGLCPECYEKKKAEEREKKNLKAAEKSKEMELPELTGTPKQVMWANTLRVAFIVNSQRVIRNNKKESMRVMDGDGNIVSYSNDTIFEALEYCIKSKTSARFWIDNRDNAGFFGDIIKEFKNRIPDDVVEEMKEEEESLTVKPENIQKDGVVKLYEKCGSLRAEYKKDSEFMKIVKEKGYSWGGKTWGKEITEFSGTIDERAAELGNVLLSKGFTVQFMNVAQRDSAISGMFEKECTRWVKYNAEEEKFCICWRGKDDDLYATSKKISGAKWSDGSMRIPLEYYKEVEEFAEIARFKFSKRAISAIKNYKEKESKFLICDVVEVNEQETPVMDNLRKTLKSRNAIIEDLKDDT